MKVLITNMTLASRTGTETFVRDLALGLLQLGHQPIVYSPDLGVMADEIRKATIPVLNDLSVLSSPPDIIHGNHHAELMTALLHFRSTPAIYTCHAWLPAVAAPPQFPRILHYVAVDLLCQERMHIEHGIPMDMITIIPHGVDSEEFQQRDSLPNRPRKALLFSNYARSSNYAATVQATCDQQNIALEIIGSGVAKSCNNPGKILTHFDLVFAKGRCALEALFSGCSVILCDGNGLGPLVTMNNVDRLRSNNFGARSMLDEVSEKNLSTALRSYDRKDAEEVCRFIRSVAPLSVAAINYLNVYEHVLSKNNQRSFHSSQEEYQALALYLTQITRYAEEIRRYEDRARIAESEVEKLKSRIAHLAKPLQDTMLAKEYTEGIKTFEICRRLLKQARNVVFPKRIAKEWHCRKGTVDIETYHEIVNKNYYRLPDRFNSEDVIIDIGAHIGCFSHAVLMRGAGECYAIEVGQENYPLLKANLKRYGDRCQCHLAAIWGNHRHAPLYFEKSPDSENTGGGGVSAIANGNLTRVLPFDQLLSNVSNNGSRRIRLVKIHCEGSEWPILLQSEQFNLVDEMIVEYHLGPLQLIFGVPDGIARLLLLQERLEELGFAFEIYNKSKSGNFGTLLAVNKTSSKSDRRHHVAA